MLLPIDNNIFVIKGQISFIIEAIADERGLDKSGIMQKLIITAPNPLTLYDTTDETTRQNFDEIGSLVAVLYAIKKLHQTSPAPTYTFTINGKNKFREYQQEFKENVKNSIYTDPFIRY